MNTDILSLSKQFISIRSTAANPKEREQILTLALSHLTGYTAETFERNGVKSALIYNFTKRPKKFRLLLNGHLDVIPAKEHQFTPKIENDRLYGAGSMDMKANAACLIEAFAMTAHQVSYPLALQLVTDEEIGGFDGTKYQVEQGVSADFVIAGEPTNFDIVHMAKGILQLKISAAGKTAHGAYPWRGENAVWKMKKVLDILQKKFPIPKKEVWETTLNLSSIESSNRTFNKIPDDCTVWLDVRFVPEDAKHILKDIKSLLPEGFSVFVNTDEAALMTPKDTPDIQTLKKITERIFGDAIKLRGANGSSDARHYSKVGCRGIEFGPIGGGIGSDEEWVDIPSLETYCKILKEFVMTMK
ncbi:MAG: M20/M25/M40 family metallo-hydrolase [Parcubacteria group bacterium]|nr:M20/M25/M40 family metallo-hydrolase [Parcubacteria group bacterium]